MATRKLHKEDARWNVWSSGSFALRVSTRCGLSMRLDAKRTTTRWRSVTCESCNRVGKRGKWGKR